jgi:hypothetical protein
LIRLPHNTGFANACNLGIRRAIDTGAEMILLTNDDTELDEFLVAQLASAAIKNPRAGLLNPVICFADQRECVWANGNTFSLFTGFGDAADCGRACTDVRREGLKHVDAATGCVALARVDVLREVGTFDDRFFMYYEDVDLSLRIRRAGYDIIAVPDARAWHRISRSGKMPESRSAFLYYYNTRNRLAVMRRHARWYHWIVFTPRFAAWLCVRLAALTVLGRREKRSAILRAVRDVVTGRYPVMAYHGGS